jgi:hypothetical protein|tara:strand:- start:379 stop:924 length:546 start_codon:yes stop_codon:yes gene_type:complete
MSQLKVNSIIPVGGVPSGGGGGIIQVKQTIKTDTFSSTSSGTHDITGLSVSITPKLSTSKILVLCDLCGHVHNGMGGAFQMKRTISSTSTTIGLADAAGSRSRSSFSGTLYTGDGGGANFIILNANARILDSPNTTSAITYQAQMVQISTALYVVNRSEFDTDNNDYTRAVSNITVMEVSA